MRRNNNPSGVRECSSSVPVPLPKLDRCNLAAPGTSAYFFTTFPVASETFLQREIRALKQLGLGPEIHSLWGGDAQFDEQPIYTFRLRELIGLLWELPRAVLRKPQPFIELLEALLDQPMPSWLNAGETLWGILFALRRYRNFKTGRYRRIHAVWASMPATAAWLVYKLTGTPFTMGAHAYDVFEDGGDWLLQLKLKDAKLIHTTTENARRRLISLGCSRDHIVLIRRGMLEFPPLKAPRSPRASIRILCVGRLVEKKGLPEQLAVYAELKRRGIPFEVRLVGEGPMRGTVECLREANGLRDHVTLTGKQTFADILLHHQWADVLVFTGKIAKNGDQDGLPNVVAEAMASGVPVIVSNVGGLPEVIEDGVTGLILNDLSPGRWADAIERLRQDDSLYDRLRVNGRKWVEQNYNARVNAANLFEAQSGATATQKSKEPSSSE